MYIPEEMKVNKFKLVNLPSNADYFARLGQFAPAPSQYTGDNVAIMDENKVDSIVDYLDYAVEQASHSNNG